MLIKLRIKLFFTDDNTRVIEVSKTPGSSIITDFIKCPDCGELYSKNIRIHHSDLDFIVFVVSDYNEPLDVVLSFSTESEVEEASIKLTEATRAKANQLIHNLKEIDHVARRVVYGGCGHKDDGGQAQSHC